jgi:Putative transposase
VLAHHHRLQFLPQPALPEVPEPAPAKAGGAAAREWLAEREAELLPVPYYHVVFTLPARIADIAYQNKAVIYDLLFKASSETMLTIAADPKHLGARIGTLSVLHTWGSAMTHHPHVHMIVPGGGFSLDGRRWVSCRPRFFLSVERAVSLVPPVVPGQAPRRLSGRCTAVLRQACPTDRSASIRCLSGAVVEHKLGGLLQTPLRGTEGVLRYLARYTHRVAISNRRLIACDQKGVTFKWKDYRLEGRERYKIMTLATHEFIRRLLMHVLPAGFHRIRYYGLLASGKRAENIARARELLTLSILPIDAIKAATTNADQPQAPERRCPCCGGRMMIIERLERGSTPRYQPSPPAPAFRIDTS